MEIFPSAVSLTGKMNKEILYITADQNVNAGMTGTVITVVTDSSDVLIDLPELAQVGNGDGFYIILMSGANTLTIDPYETDQIESSSEAYQSSTSGSLLSMAKLSDQWDVKYISGTWTRQAYPTTTTTAVPTTTTIAPTTTTAAPTTTTT